MPREGTLPPLFYYLLHYWISIAGQSELAVRFLSLLCGVLAVPLLYACVARTLDRRVGAIAAGFAALSPFWIYYSQETRTYALVTTLLLLALYLMLRAAQDEAWHTKGWPWVAYAFAAAAAMASYYFAGFALATTACWLLVQQRQRPAVVLRCLLGQIGALLLLLPLLVYVAPSLLVTVGSVARAAMPISTAARHLALVFNFGASVEIERVWLLIAVAFGIALLGLLADFRRAAFWALAAILPVLAIHTVGFVPYSGWARYFMTASPAWYALLAVGLSTITRGFRTGAPKHPLGLPSHPSQTFSRFTPPVLAALAATLLLSGIALSLRNYYFDPAYWRHDLRSGARLVDSVVTPDVGVIVNGPRQFPSFLYYFRQNLPWDQLPRSNSTAIATSQVLADMAQRFRGLWLVKYRPPDFDPDGLVERWLGENAYKLSIRWIENTTYSLYLTEDASSPRLVASFPLARGFGDNLDIADYRATLVQAQGAEYLLVTLAWHVRQLPTDDLNVFAHLKDAAGNKVAQSDHRPVDGTRPSSTWTPGETLTDRFALLLPKDYAERALGLEVGIYHPDGTRLPVRGLSTADNSLSLPLPGLNPMSIGHSLPYRLGDGIVFLGYDTPRPTERPGEALDLTLYWQRAGLIPRSYTVFTHLLSAGDRVVSQQDSLPQGGRRPTTSWLQGEVLADHYRLPVPHDLPPGRYSIELGMYDLETGRRLPVLQNSAESDGQDDADRIVLKDVVEVTAGWR